VYMDDILIPTETVEENLLLIEEVLTTLKKYKFEVNYSKCQFLKAKIEFLGYIISRNNITLRGYIYLETSKKSKKLFLS